jgi:hypothetical protein
MGGNERRLALSLSLSGTASKKIKKEEPPFMRGPSSWTKTDSKITNPFVAHRAMAERDLHLNKYIGGKIDHELLQRILFDYLLPLLELVKDSFGDKAGELNNRLSFVAIPILIMTLSKKTAPNPVPLPEAQSAAVQEAVDVLKRLPKQLQGNAEMLHKKIAALTSDLSRLLRINDEGSKQDMNEDDNEPEYCRFRSRMDQEQELANVSVSVKDLSC